LLLPVYSKHGVAYPMSGHNLIFMGESIVFCSMCMMSS